MTNSIDIERYFDNTCEWKPVCSDDYSEFGLEHKQEPIILKCFKYSTGASLGKSVFSINNQEIIIRSTTNYYVKEPRIKEGDRIDNMVVNVVDPYYWKGKYQFSVCGVI